MSAPLIEPEDKQPDEKIEIRLRPETRPGTSRLWRVHERQFRQPRCVGRVEATVPRRQRLQVLPRCQPECRLAEGAEHPQEQVSGDPRSSLSRRQK